MSHEFKLQFDRLNNANDTDTDSEAKYNIESSVRNVCFEQMNGKMIFLNYGYLASAEYLPDEKIITLYFTSHTITLKGERLKKLYQEFFSHSPKYIVCSDERYNSIEEDTYIVNVIEVIKI